ncbi:carbohydrate ABC transporter permease [Cohnella silvisoli]|uniref:Carbohydrate ABC transporter permease n=1 Tax=Cohnella silvisoli TaxID=2873699 RepID=A0ABV1KMH7_9BACL|nr:carbohydrate ABC transporter permease [Cohnella silvisoli]MCD9020651.1 carbohydrate ABC transporter permease [Cohnella silvisoli]
MMKTYSIWQRAVLHLMLLILAVMCIVPLILVVSASFSDETAIVKYGYTLLPKVISTYAYKYILSNPSQIFQAYGVTIFVTAIGTVFSLAISSCLAYVLSRKDFAYGRKFSFVIYFTMLFNGGLVPNYMLVTQALHMKNSVWALILPYLVIPWFVLLLRTYFADIPESLIESAKIESAGEFRILFSIVLPLSLPAMATVGLFIILMYWNDWYLALLYLDDSKKYPLQYLLYNIMQNLSAIQANPMPGLKIKLPGENTRMAIAVLATGPILFAFLFVQRFFIAGLKVGAVKG